MGRRRFRIRATCKRRWYELLTPVTAHLPEPDRCAVEDALAVPVLQAYGRRQLAMWHTQEHPLAYLQHLAASP